MAEDAIDYVNEFEELKKKEQLKTRYQLMKENDTRSYVPDQLEAKAALYRERNKIYGDNYKRFGPILSLILSGQKLDPEDATQMNRLGILVQIVAKVSRYGENFSRGGHDDSLDDIAVYSMMLRELDNLARENAAR